MNRLMTCLASPREGAHEMVTDDRGRRLRTPRANRSDSNMFQLLLELCVHLGGRGAGKLPKGARAPERQFASGRANGQTDGRTVGQTGGPDASVAINENVV